MSRDSRWHYSGQQKTAEPIGTPELLRLAAEGRIKPTDLVRRSGSPRWISAARVEGLFCAPAPEWYYRHAGAEARIGPVTLGRLRRRARRGQIQPEDLVWKPGLRRWRPARNIVGLFPRDRRGSSSREKPTTDQEGRSERGSSSRPGIACGRPHWTSRRGWLAAVLSVGLAAGIIGRLGGRTATRVEPTSQPVAIIASLVDRDRGQPDGARTASTESPRPSNPRIPLRDGDPTIAPPPAPSPLDPIAIAASRPPVRREFVQEAADPDPKPKPKPDLGRAVHELILARHEVLDEPALVDRLRGAEASIRGESLPSDQDVRFTILDSDGVFAFSHPGGYVYVSRGLFNFVRDDVELQFVLGRELALLEARHLERQARTKSQAEASAARAPIDPARRLYYQIAAGYADDQVFDADARAYLALRRLGHPDYKAASFLRRYVNYVAEYEPGPAHRRPGTSVGDDRQEIENHWRSHPPAQTRSERLHTLERSELPERTAASGTRR